MLDYLYALVAARRRRWYERHPEARRRLRQPVISIGNLSVGGTGKTPLVSLIARWLLSEGERPAILSRGYKRRRPQREVVVVSDAARVRASLDTAGDEPLMLARSIPGAVVCVHADRHTAGRTAEEQLGATVHLLDDGFQHLGLKRDLDILLTTRGEVTGDRVLPFGRLREGRAAAARADLVVVMETDRDGARQEAWELGVSQWVAARRRLVATDDSALMSGDRGVTGAGATGAPPVFAVAGIAHPEQFFRMLRDAGYHLVGSLAFADHHRYGPRDLDRIAREISAAGAAHLITTAKDAVRFEPLGALPFSLVPIEMRLVLDPMETLTAAIEAALHRARHAA